MITSDRRASEGTFHTLELQEFDDQCSATPDMIDEPVGGDDDPLLVDGEDVIEERGSGTTWEAAKAYWPYYANTFKGFFGSNYLSISFAFTHSGYMLGIVAMCGIALITGHGCHLLVSSKRILEQRRAEAQEASGSSQTPVRSVKYGTLGEFAWGKPGRFVVEFALVVTQYGFCTGYIVFLGDTLESLIDFGGFDVDLNDPSYQLACLWAPVSVILALCMIRDISSLGWTSMIATVTLCSGAFVILGNNIARLDSIPSSDAVAFKFRSFPVFFGIVVSAFEGIGVMLPIQESLSVIGKPNQFGPMLSRVLSACTLLLGGFGMVNYMIFGSRTPQIILHTMAEDSSIGFLVRVSLFGGILLGVPLQMVPIFEIFERLALKWCCVANRAVVYDTLQQDTILGPDSQPMNLNTSGSTSLSEADGGISVEELEDVNTLTPQPVQHQTIEISPVARVITRTLAVCLAAVFATVARHDFGFIGAIAGSTGGVLLAFVFPAMIDIKLNKDTIPRFMMIKDYAITGFGIVGGVVGLYLTIIDLEEKH